MAKTVSSLKAVFSSTLTLSLVLLALSFALLTSAPPVLSQPVLPEAARYDCNRVLNGTAETISGCCVKPGWERGDADGDGKLNLCDPCPDDALDQKDENGTCCLPAARGCDNVCWSGKVPGCDDVCGSGKVDDVCGVCGGSGLNTSGCCGTLTKDCAGTCGGTKVNDVCSVCDGPGLNSSGCCGTLTKDCAGTCGGSAVYSGCDNACNSTKVNDVCNVCGGSGLNASGCCGTLTKDCAGTCGGSAVYGGCDNACNSTRAADKYWTYHHYTQGVLPGDAMNWLPAIPTGWAQDQNNNNMVFGGLGVGSGLCWAGCLWDNLWGAGFNCTQRCLYAEWFVHVYDADSGEAKDCHNQFENKIGNISTFFNSITTYYDSSCNEVNPSGACWVYAGAHTDGWEFNVLKMITTAVFGVIWAMFPGLGFSPVSLDWDSSLDNAVNFDPSAYHAPANYDSYNEEKPTFTKFPLDPRSPDKWVAWRASDRAPLLVFDPKHTGQITSAEQLFGNFTFGKRWTHGYEPLATLDLNADGEVSGDELKDLGLWFDANRNGISEPGEVKTLAEKKVTKLFYTPQTVLSSQGMVVATRGYSRKVGDKDFVGSSRDWFAGAFDKKVQKDEFIKRGFAAPESVDEPKSGTIPALETSDLNGAWNWKVEKPIDTPIGPIEPSGVLTFKETTAGISGSSKRILPPDVEPVDSLRIAPLAGRRLSEGQDRKFQFTVQAGQQLVHSTATLLPDGTMRGLSEVEGGRDATTGEIYVVSYSWTATKSDEAKETSSPAQMNK